MPKFEYTVTVECDTSDEAEEAMAKRLDHEEEYGFNYYIERRPNALWPEALGHQTRSVPRAPIGRAPIGWEARCTKCDETFNPDGPNDTIHLMTVMGKVCGGKGVVTGSWY